MAFDLLLTSPWCPAAPFLWAILLVPACCEWQREAWLNSDVAHTSGLRSELQTGMVSELRVGAGGGVYGAADPLGPGGRKLKIILHGDVILISNWTCSDECKPPHEEEAAVPGLEKINACTESQQVGSLQLQEDLDLKCLGSNLTCDDIQNNATWTNWKETLYPNCNQDEDVLHAECVLKCRFNMHPTKRCTYTFDRRNKYGMHGTTGMYGFHHCVLLKMCIGNSTTEDNHLYCNTTETHAVLMSSTGSTTVGPTPIITTTTRVATPAVAEVHPAKSEGSGGGAVIGAIIGGGIVALLGLLGVSAYCLMRGKSPARPTGSSAGVPVENLGGAESTVVVGRPVAPPAGQTVEGPDGEKTSEKAS